MSASRLRLSASKTQVKWLGSTRQLRQINVGDILTSQSCRRTSKVVGSARDLGVVIDSQMSLSAHTCARCRSAYYQLRQLRPAARPLTTEAAKTFVQAFIYNASGSTAIRCCKMSPTISCVKSSQCRMPRHASSR